ncbi:MAG: hypothetical protein R3F59_27165 [Myxococcota bacterium]
MRCEWHRSVGWSLGASLLALPVLGSISCKEVVPYKVRSDFDGGLHHTDLPDDPATDGDDANGWQSDYGAMTATIHYDASLNDSPGCDAVIELTGRTYEGGCPNCTFAFDVDAEVVSSGAPTEDCPMIPAWTFLSDGVTINPKIGFSPSYVGFDEVLWFGYGIDLSDRGYDVLEGPVWTLIHYDGFSGDLAWDAESLEWDSELELEYGYGPSPLFDYACVADRSDPTPRLTDVAMHPQTLPMDYRHMDVYEVPIDAGSELRVGVDTVSADDAFQPYVVVIAPDGCVIGGNFSAYQCSFPARASGAGA